MNHYLLTRCAYNPALWDDDANDRRLELFTGVTVASLHAVNRHLDAFGQRPPTWLLAVHPDDPNLDARQAAAESSGLPVILITANTPPGDHDRAAAAWAAYTSPWTDGMAFKAPRLTTRIDDDDAFATTTITRLYRHLADNPPGIRRAYIFPRGHRVYGGRFTPVRHETNAWVTLYAPTGDHVTAVTFAHRKIKENVPYTFVDDDPAWLWVRHPDTLSGWHRAAKPISASLRRRYPVNWELLDPDGAPTVQPIAGGERFR